MRELKNDLMSKPPKGLEEAYDKDVNYFISDT